MTFTVATTTSGLGCREGGSACPTSTLTYDGTPYFIQRVLLLADGKLEIWTDQSSISAKTLSDLTLHVGSDSFPFADANDNFGVLEWSNSGLSWSTGDLVTLTATYELTAPSVDSIAFNSAGSDGAFKTGEAVTATVTFSESVTVDTTGGTPELTIDVGGSDKVLTYASGTGTAALVFTGYTVAANDADTDGISIAANKLDDNDGTIKATADATKDAVLTHAAVAASANHKVDGVKPTLSSANASGDLSKVVLTFSEAIGSVDNTKITVKKGGTTQTTTGAAIDSTNSTKVEITLMTALLTTDTNITVDLAADAVTDVPGNGNAEDLATAVTLVDNTPPTLSSAGTYAIGGTGTGIALQFNETIASTSIPLTSAFAAKIAGTAVGVTSVTRDTTNTDTVNLVLNANPKAGDSVTVSYTTPGSNPLEDEASNNVASFTDEAVTNNATAPGKPTVTVAAKDASLEVTVAFTDHGTHTTSRSTSTR